MVCSAEISRSNGAKSKGAVTEKGKVIASKNATKHGLLAQKPPILASEDLETFQGLVQALSDQYQPLGALEWHLVQSIGMCIQRQHRVWAAEAAVGNESLLPPVPQPYTDEKYQTHADVDRNYGKKTVNHPENLQLEHKVLSSFLKHFKLEDFPTGLRSKYWSDMWADWFKSISHHLKALRKDYPVDCLCGGEFDFQMLLSDDERFERWVRELNEANHPYGKVWFYQLRSDSCPTSKYEWSCRRSRYENLLDSLKARLQQIDDINAEIQQEKERYQRETEERRLATVNLIPDQLALISRYESHITKRMKEAIAQLSELQNQRKT